MSAAAPTPRPPVDSRPPPATPRCAAHDGEDATGTCARCGTFVCARCLDPEPDAPAWCAACRARVGADRMPWEGAGGWARRWARTTSLLLRRPTRTLERIVPGRIGPALRYAGVTGALLGAVLGIGWGGLIALALITTVPGTSTATNAGAVAAPLVATAILAPALGALGAVGLAILRGAAFFVGARVAGGRGSIRVGIWTAGYLGAIHVSGVALVALAAVPVLGPLLVALGLLAMEVWTAVHLTTAARRGHALEGGRAALAGWLPFVGGVALLVGGCALLGAALNALA